MLLDQAEVIFKGGHGGAGKVSFGKMLRSGPDGGSGGRGGDLYVKASSDITLLNQFSQKNVFSAQNGYPGERKNKTGKDGEDIEVLLPVGTSLINKETGETILEFTKVGERKLLCKGGKGGRGNREFRSATNQAPETFQKGLPGRELSLTLSLKLIADFGLVGLPNAGKTSILNELTRAQAKIANYPFTTLSPNLGVYEGKFLADIPGLIEGASEGRGLGISFLKHIEKVEVILHCISSESADVSRDYKTVRNEMEKFNPELTKKKEIILLTKSDLIDAKTQSKLVKKLSKTYGSVGKTKAKKVLPVSIHDWDSLETLKSFLLARR